MNVFFGVETQRLRLFSVNRRKWECECVCVFVDSEASDVVAGDGEGVHRVTEVHDLT